MIHADLDRLIAQYEEWLARPPAYSGDPHASTIRERLAHLTAQREAATRCYATAA